MYALVAEFPFISREEFWQACKQLHSISIAGSMLLSEGAAGLRITKHLEAARSDGSAIEHHAEASVGLANTCQDHETEFEQVDEAEITFSHHGPATGTVTYDILLSPSYQVPVLYLSANRGPSSTCQLPLSELYDVVVPEATRAALQSVGVMGAVSMTDHPATGLPVYFVHPCRTAEALRASSETNQVSPGEYLLLWLGIIGGTVGLRVPLDAARMVT
ncbi:hypothetical protein MBLNU459_g8216t1 [Dothideomycetes sp. NU459]